MSFMCNINVTDREIKDGQGQRLSGQSDYYENMRTLVQITSTYGKSRHSNILKPQR